MMSRIVLARVYNRKFDSSLIEEHKYGPTAGLKANAAGKVWGKPFHTDEMGGRKNRHNNKGKPKLLIIGDSVTEGVGVDDTATFASIISDRLDSFDVRNVSLIGWSVNNYKDAIDTILAHDSTVAAIKLFYCLNDIYGPSKAKDLPQMGNKGMMSSINALLQDKYATYKLVKLFFYQNSGRYYDYDRELYKDSSRVNAVVHTLESIATKCLYKSIKFDVYILPYRSQMRNKDGLPQRVLEDKLDKTYVDYHDAWANFMLITIGHSNALYLWADEIHLSPQGNAAIADIVLAK
jgi:lysophospholipase L1-like esterase